MKAKRHRWDKGIRWCRCLDCGCRYRRGMVQRIYEQPDGSNTRYAGTCQPQPQEKKL